MQRSTRFLPPGRAGLARSRAPPTAWTAARAAAAAHLSAAGQQQVTVALAMMTCLEDQLHAMRRQLLDTARHMKGARVLARELYGVGPVTALALTCWLGGACGSPPPARQSASPAWTSPSTPATASAPGRLSRQGPPVLRWAVYEAGKTHARASAPDHAYYAQVKDRKNGKRAALSEARKIIRRACHILSDLGDDAFAAA